MVGRWVWIDTKTCNPAFVWSKTSRVPLWVPGVRGPWCLAHASAYYDNYVTGTIPENLYSFIHSFNQVISIAPLQSATSQKRSRHSIRAVSRRSATDNSELRTCPRSIAWGLERDIWANSTRELRIIIRILNWIRPGHRTQWRVSRSEADMRTNAVRPPLYWAAA